MRLNLNDAGDRWVDLRDPSEITEAGRRTFKIYSAAAQVPDDKATLLDRGELLAKADDYMIAMFIRDWSLGAPIPQAQIERLHELGGLEFDKLRDACQRRLPEVFVDFSATKEDLANDAPLDTPFLAPRTAPVDMGGNEGAESGGPAAAAGLPGEDPALQAGEVAARVDAG